MGPLDIQFLDQTTQPRRLLLCPPLLELPVRTRFSNTAGPANPPVSTEERSAATSRTAIGGALVNVTLSVIKVGAGIVGQSQALIADGIHSLSDL